MPPAEAYGVATFYALFATTPRPPAVAHVCDDIACRLAGAEELCATLERSLGAGRRAGPRRPDDLAPQPVPGPVRARARGAVHGRRRARRATVAVAPIDAAGVVGRLERRPRSLDAPSPSAPADRLRHVGPAGRRAGLRLLGARRPRRPDRRSTPTAPTAATARSTRALELGPAA